LPQAPPDNGSTSAHVAGAAASGASDMANTARDGIKDVADEAVTQVEAVAGGARQQVSTLVDQMKGELPSRPTSAPCRLPTGQCTLQLESN
jgi:hypothetical protein